ncbi:MAG: hypothetical protein CVU40_13755 [Chloroflexi bacterium HGW-Chloroflexi-2]|nr:MAG: hypothetical protein CVU40_13755 [Chloroflexi bacterium HGW-Chloroflexi-2]
MDDGKHRVDAGCFYWGRQWGVCDRIQIGVVSMLNKLLDLINQGGSLTPNTLAQQLDTTPAMVEMMIEELTRRGMLKVSEFEKNCDSESCGSCYLSKTCHSNTQRVWTSTTQK